MIGRVLGGRYEIIERLGTGGMSVVYKAHCTVLRRHVAVKILHEQFADDEEFLSHFRREAWAAAGLSHPNIVNIYDVGEEPEERIHYIVMEYIPGSSLKELLQREGPLTPRRATTIALEILKALHFAHSKGVIHRDIKPDNIIVDDTGRVKVTDFGIARAQDLGTLVPTSKVMGSARYMSPEQARGRYTDARSDLYSLGIVLFQMVTGTLPFDGETAVGIALDHIHTAAPDPVLYKEDVPEGLRQVILCALEKDPARRYPTAEAMGEDLVAAIKNQPVWAATRSQADDHTRAFDPLSDGALPPDRRSRREASRKNDRVRRESVTPAEPSTSKAWIAWLVLFMLVLALVGYTAFWVRDWFQVPIVDVPLIVGERLSTAESVLEEHGLRAEVVASMHHDEMPANYVLLQSPVGGSQVRRGQVIQLTLSEGPEWLDGGTPEVVGLYVSQATIVLENVGLLVETEEVFHDEIPLGQVIRQDPEPADRIQRGSQVYLRVSRGQEPQPFAVSGFIGRTESEAVTRLVAAGLDYRIVRETTAFPAGVVASQEPRIGTEVSPGDTVTLVVSRGNEEESHQDTLSVTLSSEPAEQRIRVEVIDQLGQRVLFHDYLSGGTTFTHTIHWFGTGARVFVYSGEALIHSDIFQREPEEEPPLEEEPPSDEEPPPDEELPEEEPEDEGDESP